MITPTESKARPVMPCLTVLTVLLTGALALLYWHLLPAVPGPVGRHGLPRGSLGLHHIRAVAPRGQLSQVQF